MFISMSGGSVGLQAGAEHQDIVLLMNDQGEQELRNGHWDLGAEATADGPTGDSAGRSESTGWNAPVLSKFIETLRANISTSLGCDN